MPSSRPISIAATCAAQKIRQYKAMRRRRSSPSTAPLTHGGAEHVQRYTQTENQNFPISHKRSPLFLLTSPLYRKSRRREETKIRKCQTNIKRDPLRLRSRLKRLRLAAAHSLRSHVCEPKVFCRRACRRQKCFEFFCACGRKLCEARYWMFKLFTVSRRDVAARSTKSVATVSATPMARQMYNVLHESGDDVAHE